MTPDRRPAYAELPDGDARGVYGEADVLGAVNLQTPDTVRAAAGLVRDGRTFTLNHPIDVPGPPLYSRRPVAWTRFTTRRGNLDDYLDSFYPQASTQWDGFLHVEHPDSGRYNGRGIEELGFETIAQRGLAGRGVLLDVAAMREADGDPIPWGAPVDITVADLERCRLRASLDRRPGDVLLIRTGWETGYRALDGEGRARLGGAAGPWAGLQATPEMYEYLWDWGASGVAADNPSLERSPVETDRLHRAVLARLGILIGELWRLDALATHCASTGRAEFLLTSAPLIIPGSAGSTANAMAIT